MAEKSSPAENVAVKGGGKGEPTSFVHVFPEWCKGCGICVAFCPTGVLEMRNQKAVVAHPEKCVRCYLCARRCPDLAIGIEDRNGRVDGAHEKEFRSSETKGEGDSR